MSSSSDDKIAQNTSVQNEENPVLVEEQSAGSQINSGQTKSQPLLSSPLPQTLSTSTSTSIEQNPNDSDVDTVFIGNLSWKIDESALKTFFASVATPISISLQRFKHTKRTRGWGLVKFPSSEDAKEVTRRLDGSELMGRKVHIHLDIQAQKSKWGVFTYNLPWSMTNNELTELYTTEVPDARDIIVHRTVGGLARGTASCRFMTEEQALKGIEKINTLQIAGRPLEARFDRCHLEKARGMGYEEPIYLTFANLPFSITKESLLELLKDDGAVKVTLQYNRKTNKKNGRALVKFQDQKLSREVYNKYDGFKLEGRALTIIPQLTLREYYESDKEDKAESKENANTKKEDKGNHGRGSASRGSHGRGGDIGRNRGRGRGRGRGRDEGRGRDRDRDRDRDVEEGEIQGEVGIVMEEEKVKTRKVCRDVEGEGSEI